jgi:CheY-like chemotaxis protein
MSGKAVLVVDDEAIILLALVHELRTGLGIGFRIETARSIDDARTVINELAVDGIELVACVTDWLMPDGRGDELLRSVRDSNANAVLMIITGNADDAELIAIARSLGVQACVTKPWARMAVAGTLKAALLP